METQYFYIKNKKEIGPLSFTEISDLITSDTIVWREGMEDWKKAKEIDDFSEILATKEFKPTPPPYITPPSYRQKTKGNRKLIYISTSIVVLLAIALTIVFIIKDKASDSNASKEDDSAFRSDRTKSTSSQSSSYNSQPRQLTEEELHQQLIQKQARSPQDYLYASNSIRYNLLNEMIIEGKIYSTATVATYKDIVLTILFYSKTGTLLGKKEYTFYDYISPNGNISYKVKLGYPYNTSYVEAKIFKAEFAY
jgi:hypothetical protein